MFKRLNRWATVILDWLMGYHICGGVRDLSSCEILIWADTDDHCVLMDLTSVRFRRYEPISMSATEVEELIIALQTNLNKLQESP